MIRMSVTVLFAMMMVGSAGAAGWGQKRATTHTITNHSEFKPAPGFHYEPHDYYIENGKRHSCDAHCQIYNYNLFYFFSVYLPSHMK